jgi:3,4-dihydroxy 2-butanone 4-phosphate synthase/GTP cyclohydrolase II
MPKSNKFNTIEEAVRDLKRGRMVIVVDDRDRENEGDLVMIAEKVTPKAINFMITHGKGLVCLPMQGDRLDSLGLTQMVYENREHMRTAFTISVDASKTHGVTTGISPADRARTIRILLNTKTSSRDFVSPGHIFPLRAMDGGVLRRAGHTEAAVDLALLAGAYPAGVICEIIKQNGEMARIPDLLRFSKKHGLKIVTIADLIGFKLKKEKLVQRVAAASLPTNFGDFKLYGYRDTLTGELHLALMRGTVKRGKSTLVRVHSQCLTGDVFGSLRCDCGDQLAGSLEIIGRSGSGVLLYMRQEGRGIGLANKLKAYELQDHGRDTVEANEILGFAADLRDYGIGAQILGDLGIKDIKLITNNPRKIVGLEGYGLRVVSRVPLEVEPNKHNIKYLRAKSEKLGHLLNNSFILKGRRGEKWERLTRVT